MSQEIDMAWLADEYRRRSDSEPSLTLEIFADQYAVSVYELRAYLPELDEDAGHSVILWHGTTKSRADSILKEGFNGKRAPIFFAQAPRMPRAIAQNRAASEHDQPVVIMCSIDLSQYSHYQQQRQGAYAFRHDCIGSEVVKEVMDARARKFRVRSEIVEFTNVAITFNSGRAGIAFWINNYLKLSGIDRIREDDEAVGKIKEWLDAQADAGRFGEVSDEEMLLQVREHLPQCLS